MLEGLNTEFKREYIDALKYSILAFANTSGGKIYIGINDDGSVHGIDDADGVLLRVTNMARDVIRPDVTMFMECTIEIMDGLPVVVVNVQRGTARPYYLRSKGVRSEGVYVRQGASSVPASMTEILRMIKETSGDSYEDSRSLQQELTFTMAEECFRESDVAFCNEQMRTLGMVGYDGTYSNLGLLLSDECQHTIKIARFAGMGKSVFQDRREVSGSLFKQLQDGYSYLNDFNHTRAEIVGLKRRETRDYPLEAIREGLINAIVHRDYSLSGAILVSIFDDRIEFVNLGGLVSGISYSDLGLGVSVPRNKRLAEVFYRLELIEAYGTGIMRMQELYSGCSRQPKIQVTDNAFKLTLPNMNYQLPEANRIGANSFYSNRNSSGHGGGVYESRGAYRIRGNSMADLPLNTMQEDCRPVERDAREAAVLELLANKKEIVRRDVQEALHISQASAILLLREMVEKGKIGKIGSGKHIKYILQY